MIVTAFTSRRGSRPLPILRSVRAWGVGACVAVLAACDASSPAAPDLGDRVEPVDRPDAVRGIYVSAFAAGSSTRLQDLLDLAEGTVLNTFVIDVKEHGDVSYLSTVPLAGEIGAETSYIGDLPMLLRTLSERGIYPIARIVAFRDPVLALARPDWAIQGADGGLWLDPEDDLPWADPYNPDVWAYNIDLAREALAAGFAEVQWDYVRFPDVSDATRATMVFPAQRKHSPADAIHDFLATARSELRVYGAPITADVFGRVITEADGSRIGQDWNRLVRVTDVLLPMVYPALYWPGNFGLPDPSAEPYRTVRAAMEHAVLRMRQTPGAIATVRPWLQAFSEGSMVYGAEELREQIRAVEDAGLREWLFWNKDSQYPAGAF